MGCAVDRRWGGRRETNQRFPGSFGVDSRWGEPRSSLLRKRWSGSTNSVSEERLMELKETRDRCLILSRRSIFLIG